MTDVSIVLMHITENAWSFKHVVDDGIDDNDDDKNGVDDVNGWSIMKFYFFELSYMKCYFGYMSVV